MILVTVGIRGQFDRLVKEVDRLKKEKVIKEKVIAQISDYHFKPNYIEKFYKYVNLEKMKYLIKKSNIVITHGGVGSITFSLNYNKPTIVVPRLKRFNEHADDHQLQITKELEKQGKIVGVYDIKNLGNAIKKIMKKKIKKQIKRGSKIEKIIINYLRTMEK